MPLKQQTRQVPSTSGQLPTTALIICEHFPGNAYAGNLAYLKFVIEIAAQSFDQVVVFVVGDRFPENQFVIKSPSAGNVRYLADFVQPLGKLLFLRHPKGILKNAARRAWSLLPAPLRRRIHQKYVSQSDHPVASGNEVPSQLLEIVKEVAPTHVFVDKLRFVGLFNHAVARDCVRFAICHDLHSERHERAVSAGYGSDMLSISAAEEFRLLSLADCVIAIQKLEAKQIERNTSARVLHLPYIPDLPVLHGVGSSTSRKPRSPHRVLFVGSGGAPNLQAIEWFLAEIWPRIVDVVPSCKLDIVGAIGDLISSPSASVTIHGRVKSLDPFYANCTAVIVPLRTGSGLKIKMVEGLAAGRACVTTAIGAQGLEEGIGTAFLMGNTADEFAQAVLHVIADHAERSRLQSEAIRFLAATFNRKKALADFQRTLDILSGDHQLHGAPQPEKQYV